MNNDIARDLNNCVNTPKRANAPLDNSSKVNTEEQMCVNSLSLDTNLDNSMNCTLGRAQVNSVNKIQSGVQKSVEEFIESPEFVEYHTQICDELVKKGYNLEEAILKTDEIFKALKTNIYQ